MPTTPYVTLLGFTRHVGRTGPGKVAFVDLRRGATFQLPNDPQTDKVDRWLTGEALAFAAAWTAAA